MDAFPISTDLLGKSASAYEHLRRAVRHGQLRPGRRLSATNLAVSFRISETPVREALVRLSAEGFLDWEASKGHFTKPVTLDEQFDLHEVIAIHLHAALQRCGGPEPELFRQIEQGSARGLVEPAETLGTCNCVAELLTELAGALVELSGNQVLRSMMSVILDRTWLIRRLDIDTPEQILQARSRAAGLVAALRAADITTALTILESHLAARRRRLPELVDAAHELVRQANYP
jgi:DNA-binding GntR family transcriptional regulator